MVTLSSSNMCTDDCHHVFRHKHCQICCALCKVSAVMYPSSDDCHHVFRYQHFCCALCKVSAVMYPSSDDCHVYSGISIVRSAVLCVRFRL